MKNVSFTPPQSFLGLGGNFISFSNRKLKLQRIFTFFFVVLVALLLNNSNLLSQVPENCDPDYDCVNNSLWGTDTMTVEIPGYSGCFAFVTYRSRVCDNGQVQFEVLYIDFFTSACFVFNSLLFPFGTMNPPNDIFLRQNWNNIVEVVMKNDFKRLWNSLPSPFRDQFYCGENIRTFNYTMYSGYCLKYCLGVYTPTITGPLQYFSVNYKNCDEEACCIHLVEYCINRTNGEVVKYSESTTQTGANCESIQTAPSCIFLQIPNYILNVHFGTCTNTCTQE